VSEPHFREPFDFEHDDRRHGGGRRRPVADWGADELFDRSPRRRRFLRQELGWSPAELDDGRRERADPGADPRRREPLARPQALPPLDVDAEVAVLAARRADPAVAPSPAAGGRRTVRIQGRPGEGAPVRRRPPRRPHERLGPRPDRVAAWAVLLGLLLVLIAVATADAATVAALLIVV